MKKSLRRLLFIPQPKVCANEALQIAFDECNRIEKEWDPQIIEGLKYWKVWTPKGWKGATQIIIDQQTGQIIHCYTISR